MIRFLSGAAAILAAVAGAAGLFAAAAHADDAGEAGNPERGAYILRAGGCVACHTDTEADGALLAGGAAIKSPFGTFYAPNITPDPVHGIGDWTEADFIRAMSEGIAPSGEPYYPSFPYPSYTRMTTRDLRDLWAYMRTVTAVAAAAPAHELGFPFNMRAALWPWRAMFFRPGTFRASPYRSPEWNRGAYLSIALGHCGECHTPRNILGGPLVAMAFAGSRAGVDGATVPNITAHREHGIGTWTESDVSWLLKTGFMPHGDDVQGTMGELVAHGTSHLSDPDLQAIAVYLRTVPPIANAVRPPPKETVPEDDDFDFDFSAPADQ